MNGLSSGSMKLFSRKVIAVYLMLLLVLMPLQAVFAGMVTSTCSMQEMDHSMLVMDHADHVSDCGMHKKKSDCSGVNCSMGHCVSVFLAVLPSVSTLSISSNASVIQTIDDRLTSQNIHSLFRPPRV